jgi:hypothetical protein
MTTPSQFSRLSQRQRMLAGLNTLGFVNPPTQASEAMGLRLPANQGVTVRAASGAQLATVAAPPGLFKRLIGSTLQAPEVSSGIDTRNSAAALMLTAAGDTLDMRTGSVLCPPQYTRLPSSNIRPNRPNVIRNPYAQAGGLGRFNLEKGLAPGTSTSTSTSTSARNLYDPNDAFYRSQPGWRWVDQLGMWVDYKDGAPSTGFQQGGLKTQKGASTVGSNSLFSLNLSPEVNERQVPESTKNRLAPLVAEYEAAQKAAQDAATRAAQEDYARRQAYANDLKAREAAANAAAIERDRLEQEQRVKNLIEQERQRKAAADAAAMAPPLDEPFEEPFIQQGITSVRPRVSPGLVIAGVAVLGVVGYLVFRK